MARYVVTSTAPVMMEWPETGDALALPAGSAFEASPYNARVIDLLQAQQIRRVEEVKEVVPEAPKPEPAPKKRARRPRKAKGDSGSKKSSS